MRTTTTVTTNDPTAPKKAKPMKRADAATPGPLPVTTEPVVMARCSTCGDEVPVPSQRPANGDARLSSVVLRDEDKARNATLHCTACGEAAMRLRVDGDCGRSVNLAVFRHAVSVARLPAGSAVRSRLAQLDAEERACRAAHAEGRRAGKYQLFGGEVADFVLDEGVLATPTAAAFKIVAYYDVLMSLSVQSFSEDGFRPPF